MGFQLLAKNSIGRWLPIQQIEFEIHDKMIQRQNMKALLLLSDELFQKYEDLDYIATHRLNQNIIENVFCSICTKGCNNKNPSPQEFNNILKCIINAKILVSVIETKASNCTIDSELINLNREPSCISHLSEAENEIRTISTESNNQLIFNKTDESDSDNDDSYYEDNVYQWDGEKNKLDDDNKNESTNFNTLVNNLVKLDSTDLQSSIAEHELPHDIFENICEDESNDDDQLNEDNAFTYVVSYIANNVLSKINCDRCRKDLIKSNDIVDEREYFIYIKIEHKNKQFSKTSSNFFIICKASIKLFQNIFKERIHYTSIKASYIKESIEIVNRLDRNWFSERDIYYNHHIKALDYLISLLT